MKWPALVLVVLVAGCTDATPPEPQPVTPSTPICDQSLQVPAVDGGHLGTAWDWMATIVYTEDGKLRPRHPEHPGHPCTADWLEAALQVDGWTVGRDTFTGADYQAIDARSGSGWRASCDEQDKQQVAGFTFHNIYAHREGGDQTLLIGAHWDAKEDADGRNLPVPAANDGASGMGVMLAMQRHIVEAGLEFPFDIVLAFFDAEDGFEDCHPLAGSIHFAFTMPVQVDRMILLDMVGDKAARFPRESSSVQSDAALVDLVWSRAADHGLGDNFVDTEKPVTDDHLPFIEVGVPAIDIIDFARPSGEGRFGFPPYWHTVEDTPDKLDPAFMEAMGELLLDVLQDPAFVDTWP